MDELKEWVKVSRSPNGCTVTVTWMRGNLTARWGVKVYAGIPGAVKNGVAEARKGARLALAELTEAIRELEAEDEGVAA